MENQMHSHSEEKLMQAIKNVESISLFIIFKCVRFCEIFKGIITDKALRIHEQKLFSLNFSS